jgi:hypothetical protein
MMDMLAVGIALAASILASFELAKAVLAGVLSAMDVNRRRKD